MAYSKNLLPDSSIPKSLIEDYLSGLSSIKIAKKYNFSKCKVLNFLKRSGVERRSKSECKRIYNCDYRYFHHIDSQEKAYWLGFLLADGNVYKNKLQLRLGKKDVDHLYKFRDCIGSSHKIHECHNCFGLIIRSDDLVKDLNCLGCTPNKTFSLVLPIFDNELQRHLIRGFFDGDGTVYLGKTGMIRVAFSSTYSICRYILDFIQSYCGLSIGGIYKEKRRTSDCWTLAIGTTNIENIRKIYDCLYKDYTICLERKRERFIKKYDTTNGHRIDWFAREGAVF